MISKVAVLASTLQKTNNVKDGLLQKFGLHEVALYADRGPLVELKCLGNKAKEIKGDFFIVSHKQDAVIRCNLSCI